MLRTFQMYLTNLKPLFVEMVRGAEMVLFNRCKDIKPLAGYRRSVKVVSPQAEVIFEGKKENWIIFLKMTFLMIWTLRVIEIQEKIMGSGMWI